MISVLTAFLCVGCKNGLHIINEYGLQGLYEINSLSFNNVIVKVILLASCMLMAS